MDASLDVFAIFGESDFLWIGCTRTDYEALELIRTQGLKKARMFFIHSQKTGRRTFYKVERESEVIQLIAAPANWSAEV
jgi:hypothetical protein